MLSAPGVPVSLFALSFAGSAWTWYSASLEPALKQQFSVSSSQTGLVFATFGLTYTVATPVFGYWTDRGLGGLTAMLGGSQTISSFGDLQSDLYTF